MHLEVRAGRPREEALRALGERTGVARSQVDGERLHPDREARHAARQDAPGPRRFRRVQRRHRAEERAHLAPLKMIFPTVFFLMPAFFLVTMAPSLLGLLKLLKALGRQLTRETPHEPTRLIAILALHVAVAAASSRRGAGHHRGRQDLERAVLAPVPALARGLLHDRVHENGSGGQRQAGAAGGGAGSMGSEVSSGSLIGTEVTGSIQNLSRLFRGSGPEPLQGHRQGQETVAITRRGLSIASRSRPSRTLPSSGSTFRTARCPPTSRRRISRTRRAFCSTTAPASTPTTSTSGRPSSGG